MDQVIGLLRSPESSLRRSQRVGTRLRLTFIMVGWLFAFSGLAGVGFSLYGEWQSGEWNWSGIYPSLIIVLTSLRLFFYADPLAHLYEPVLELRAAIVNGDDALAPKASSEYYRDHPAMPVSHGNMIGPLNRPQTATDRLVYILGGLVSFLGFLAALICATIPESAGATIYFLLGSVVWTLVVVAFAIWRRRPLWVSVGADNLGWRSPSGRRRQLEIHRVRAFSVATERRGRNFDLVTTYVLDGGNQTLAWRLRHARADETAAAQYLAKEVQQRTGLTLRDVSTEVRRISRLEPPQKQREKPSAAATSAIAIAAPSPQPRTPAWAWLMPALIVVLVSGGIVGAQVYQAQMHSQLYSKAHANKPCYSDTFKTDDGLWPVTSTSAYVGGAYQVQVVDALTDLAVWTPTRPPSCVTALVEVSGSVGTSSDFGGMGLVIRRPDHTGRPLVFEVNAGGEWWLSRFSSDSLEEDDQWSVIDIEQNRAIHAGSAWNRIAVAQQGDEYAFYVNGQFVTDYAASELVGGQIGLYINLIADSASFNNFAIYPLN